MRIFFLLLFAEVVAVVETLVLMQPGSFAWVDPDVVVSRFLHKEIAGQDAVHGGILHIDMEVGASHGDDDVEIELQFMTDAALD